MPNHTERTDVYLYVRILVNLEITGGWRLIRTAAHQGSKVVLKFRSPNEFFGHAG